jgi:hypothetical protein
MAEVERLKKADAATKVFGGIMMRMDDLRVDEIIAAIDNGESVEE